ncbi:MAG: DUF2298 domain-containing protein, partial [Dehalococcoidia bacterium]
RRRTWIPLRPGPPEALAIVGSALILGALAWQPGYATVAEIGLLELLLLNLLALQWGRRAEELGGLVTTALFAGGFAIVAGMDLVTVDGDIVRMNTVFKFSLQAWQMFAAASGFAVWYVIRTLPSLPATPGLRRAVRMSVWTGAGLLAAVSCIYAVSGTPARLAARFPHDTRGLDGLAYLDVARYHEDAGTSSPDDDRDLVLGNDRPLIDWLRANVDGSPVIAEAVGPLYHWTGRIAMNTGLPAVIGWDWHQVQQRGSYAGLISQRRSDTARFFRETNVGWLESYLRKYNVRYVVIGTEELVYGTPEARARMAESPAVSEVFREGEYAIYRVDQELLPPPVLPLLR